MEKCSQKVAGVVEMEGNNKECLVGDGMDPMKVEVQSLSKRELNKENRQKELDGWSIIEKMEKIRNKVKEELKKSELKGPRSDRSNKKVKEELKKIKEEDYKDEQKENGKDKDISWEERMFNRLENQKKVANKKEDLSLKTPKKIGVIESNKSQELVSKDFPDNKQQKPSKVLISLPNSQDSKESKTMKDLKDVLKTSKDFKDPTDFKLPKIPTISKPLKDIKNIDIFNYIKELKQTGLYPKDSKEDEMNVQLVQGMMNKNSSGLFGDLFKLEISSDHHDEIVATVLGEFELVKTFLNANYIGISQPPPLPGEENMGLTPRRNQSSDTPFVSQTPQYFMRTPRRDYDAFPNEAGSQHFLRYSSYGRVSERHPFYYRNNGANGCGGGGGGPAGSGSGYYGPPPKSMRGNNGMPVPMGYPPYPMPRAYWKPYMRPPPNLRMMPGPYRQMDYFFNRFPVPMSRNLHSAYGPYD